jgi:hypothetical protein
VVPARPMYPFAPFPDVAMLGAAVLLPLPCVPGAGAGQSGSATDPPDTD